MPCGSCGALRDLAVLAEWVDTAAVAATRENNQLAVCPFGDVHLQEPQAPEGYVFNRCDYAVKGAVYVMRANGAKVFQHGSADVAYYPAGHIAAEGNSDPRRWEGHETARQWAAHMIREVAPPLREFEHEHAGECLPAGWSWCHISFCAAKYDDSRYAQISKGSGRRHCSGKVPPEVWSAVEARARRLGIFAPSKYAFNRCPEGVIVQCHAKAPRVLVTDEYIFQELDWLAADHHKLALNWALRMLNDPAIPDSGWDKDTKEFSTGCKTGRLSSTEPNISNVLSTSQ
jgi:hypothetical protein